MDKFKEIRPVVLGIVKKDEKILVSRGYDSSRKEFFYRCIGGGIDFLERSEDALKREFIEELNVEIKVGRFLGISENIFKYKGKDAHELILFYDVSIKNEDYKFSYKLIDDEDEYEALWVDINTFKKGENTIYPKEILNIL